MARNKVLHFDFELTNDARGIFGQQGKVTLYKGRGEGMAHIAMKLLSYLWFYHPDLRIEKSADQNWKPDLVRFDAIGDPIQWVDCGATKRHKLDRISVKNKKTFIDIVKKTPTELSLYKEMVERVLRVPDRVRYWTVDPGFLEEMCSLMHGRHAISTIIYGDMEFMYLCLDDHVLETNIHRL